MRSALLSLVLALPLPLYAALSAGPDQEPRGAATQDPASGEPGAEAESDEPTADLYGKQAKAGARGRLDGCWRLTELQLEGFPARGRKDAGVLLVHDDFLAFELHVGWAGGKERPAMQQSFIAEYELVRGRELRVKSLLGAYIDQGMGDFNWGRNSFARDYRVSVAGNHLELSFGQGNVLTYVRQRPKSSRSRDIFGRQRPEADGVRDIFGRPVQRPAEPEESGASPGAEPGGGSGAPR